MEGQFAWDEKEGEFLYTNVKENKKFTKSFKAGKEVKI
jgi:hypothetical protein